MNLRRIISLFLIVLFCFASFSFPLRSIEVIESNTIYVDDNNTLGPWDGSQEHPYQFIQDGIDNASDGDTVYVYNGTYYESIQINTLSLSIVGESKYSCIVDGTGSQVIFNVLGFHVIIEKFTIQNSSKNGVGIKIGDFLSCCDAKIENNIITNTGYGIFTPSTNMGLRHNQHQIKNNVIKNSSNCGIILKVTDKSIIANNNFISNKCGIKLEWSIGNRIKQNNFIDNELDATFDSGFCTIWSSNFYSNHNSNFPFLIYGTLFEMKYPWFNVDWHPAKEPYEIDIGD